MWEVHRADVLEALSGVVGVQRGVAFPGVEAEPVGSYSGGQVVGEVEEGTAEVAACVSPGDDHAVEVEGRLCLLGWCPELGVRVVVDRECAYDLVAEVGEVTGAPFDGAQAAVGGARAGLTGLPLVQSFGGQPGGGVGVEALDDGEVGGFSPAERQGRHRVWPVRKR